MPKGRLTTPLVRSGGTLQPASWDEALDAVAEGFNRARQTDTDRVLRDVLVLQGIERDELPGAEVRAPGDGHEQHRFM